LLLAPLGAKNPPAAAVGHILTAASSTATGADLRLYTLPNTVTGAVHRSPVELRATLMDKAAGDALSMAISGITMFYRQAV
jgi:hypothetical protein